MPAWKNITLSLPEQDLMIVSDKISTIRRVLSITIIDRLTESKSEWFDQLDESQKLKGETHLIQLLVSAVTESKDLLKDISSLINDKSIEIVSEEIFEDRDWIQHSKNQFREVLISDSFRIIPPWIADKGFSGKTILIEPGSGFGTGTHPTTQLCLKWMEKYLVENTDILDYGCGSGILSIAAHKLGAKTVLGIDNDYQALRNAERNKSLNSADINLLHTSDYQNQTKFDIVIVNILLKTIISLKESLLSSLKPKSKLLLTGILKDQTIELINSFAPEITLNIFDEQEDWLLFYGEKNN